MATINETATSAGVTSRVDELHNLKIDYMEMQDAWLHSPEQTIPNRIAQKRGKLAGLKSQFMAPTSPPTGVGSRLEKFRLPTHRASSGALPEILARAFKLRTRITTEADLASKAKGTQGAYAAIKSLEQQMIREQLARQWIGNLVRGNFDVLGVVASSDGATAADTATVVTLQGRNARRSTSGLTFAVGTSRQLPFCVGMPVQLVRAANGVGGSPANLTTLGTIGEWHVSAMDASDVDNPTITLTPPSGIGAGTAGASGGFGGAVAAGDFIIGYASRRDVVDATAATAISDYAGMNGLTQSQTGTGVYSAYLGLAKSTNDGLLANHSVGSPAGTARDYNKIIAGQVIRNSWERSGQRPSQAICAPEMLDEVFKEVMGQQRYGAVVSETGWENLKLIAQGVNMGFDVDFIMHPGCLDMVNDKFQGYFETCPLMSPDPISERYVPDYDQLETVLVKIGNTACTRPFAGGRVDDLNYNHG